MYQQLPAGLDPVKAGRLGLWLLGQRSHRRALRRNVSATRVSTGSLGSRFSTLFTPWTVHTYPSAAQALAELCGVKASYARLWLRRDGRLPTRHARTLARIAREREAAWRAVAEELEGRSQGF